MARSSYIYQVSIFDDLWVAFTVKHEMISWLKKDERDLTGVGIARIRDGASGEFQKPVYISAKEFLENGGVF